MLEYFSRIFEYVNEMSKGNQFIAGAISVWGLGVVTYVCRYVPSKIYAFLLKHLTTEMTITSQHCSFHNLQTWLNENRFADKFRKIKLTNGKWGYDDKAIKTVGYGSHIMWYRFRPIMITLKREETKTEYDKEIVTLSKLGRSHKLLNSIIEDICEHKKKNLEKMEVYKFSDKTWNYVNELPKRPLESVFVEQEKLDFIVNRINKFINSEQWYIENGIPYQIGILLYGPPGTGKTSLIKAIAGHLDKTIAIANAGSLFCAESLFSGMPKNSMLVIEDIDSSSLTAKRVMSEKNDIEEETKEPESVETLVKKADEKPKSDVQSEMDSVKDLLMREYMSSGISGLLNALDGIVSVHGRIMFMTTNHPEQLDNALIRPGRIDLKIEITYVNEETFAKFFGKFYKDKMDLLKGRKVKEKITCAKLQECVLNKDDAKTVIEKYTVKDCNE